MTPEQQRIAIAGACGWVTDAGYENSLRDNVFYGSCPSESVKWKQCHDYLNDLNACHDMEKGLTADEWSNYRLTLTEVCTHYRLVEWQGFAINSTALQRAEAFLRVKGLWK